MQLFLFLKDRLSFVLLNTISKKKNLSSVPLKKELDFLLTSPVFAVWQRLGKYFFLFLGKKIIIHMQNSFLIALGKYVVYMDLIVGLDDS
jgi:hypothetical protein